MLSSEINFGDFDIYFLITRVNRLLNGWKHTMHIDLFMLAALSQQAPCCLKHIFKEDCCSLNYNDLKQWSTKWDCLGSSWFGALPWTLCGFLFFVELDLKNVHGSLLWCLEFSGSKPQICANDCNLNTAKVLYHYDK